MRRRSAFVIFQAIKPLLNAGKLLTGNKILKNGSKLSKPILDASDSQQSIPDSIDMTDEQNASPDSQTDGIVPVAVTTTGTRKSTIRTVTAATAISNGQSQKCSKIVQNARKTLKCCDSKKLARINRDKMLQEKEDFQLAKMLQECIGTSDTSSRYSLRSRFRNKSSVSSSLSSSASSTQDLFQLKFGGSGGGGGSFVCATTTSKFKKSTLPFPDSSSSTNDTTPTTRTSTALSSANGTAAAAGAAATRSQRNNSNDNSNDKFMEFSFQKLTRSRRIAMTMSGV